jgi:hypothetical protein
VDDDTPYRQTISEIITETGKYHHNTKSATSSDHLSLGLMLAIAAAADQTYRKIAAL